MSYAKVGINTEVGSKNLMQMNCVGFSAVLGLITRAKAELMV